MFTQDFTQGEIYYQVLKMQHHIWEAVLEMQYIKLTDRKQQ